MEIIDINLLKMSVDEQNNIEDCVKWIIDNKEASITDESPFPFVIKIVHELHVKGYKNIEVIYSNDGKSRPSDVNIKLL